MAATSAIPIDPHVIYEKFRSLSQQGHHFCFIFGAGASAGYSRLESQPSPPVVSELFDDSNEIVRMVIRRGAHETILRRRDDIKEALIEHGGDLEAYLGHLYSLNKSHELFTRLLLYLQDVCFAASESVDLNRVTNNYLRLIYRMESLRGTNWSCVTFNYDTILEKTFVAAGSDIRRFSTFEDYRSDPVIVKAHGGVNFRYRHTEPAGKPRQAKQIFELMMNHPDDSSADTVVPWDIFSDALPPLQHMTKVPQPSGPQHLSIYDFPAMMVPVHNTGVSHSQFFERSVSAALAEIDRAKLIVAIGYNFGDVVFVQGLRKLKLAGKEIILVNGADFSNSPNDCLGYKNISSFWDGPTYLFRGAKFSAFVDSIGPGKPPIADSP